MLGSLGLALMLFVLAAFVAPPRYAALAFLTGEWLEGAATLIAWFVVLRFRRPILRGTFEGMENASL